MWDLARPEGISEESNAKQWQISSLQAPSLLLLLKDLIPAQLDKPKLPGKLSAWS